MAQINIRKITAQDKVGIAVLYNIDVDVYDWLFRNPIEKPIIGYVAEVDNKLVGVDIRIPLMLKVGDKLLTAYCGGPTVAKYYRGNWIYPKLTLATFGEIKQLGSVAYGFPNQVVTFLVKRKFMNFVKAIPEYVKIFSPRFLANKKAKNKLLSKLLMPAAWLKLKFVFPFRFQDDASIEIEKIDTFDQRINKFWETVASDYRIILRRDREYLNWRYTQEPHKQYKIFIAKKNEEILGYIILDIKRLQKDESRCTIMDLLTIKEPAVILKLLRCATDFLREEKVDVITYLVSDSYQTRELKKMGFIKGKHSRALAAVSNSVEADDGVFLNPENWFVTTGEILYA